MNRHKAVLVPMIILFLLGWGGWEDIWGQAYPTAEQIKRQLMPSTPINSPPRTEIKTMGVRVRPASRDKEIAPRTREINLSVPFELNSAEISSGAGAILRELGTALSSRELRGNIFEIQGHTCTLGNPQENLTLSQHRAEAVKKYLVKQFGLDPDQLLARGLGESKPIAKNDTEEGRQQNRRVTVVNTMQPYHGEKAQPVMQVQAILLRSHSEIPMTTGMVLREDDDYALTFMASQSCFVYVYQKDARGKLQQLFPSSPESLDVTSQRNPVQPKIAYRLPEARNRWLCLDENKGAEHLVVIAYPDEIPNPTQICQGILNGGLDYRQVLPKVAPEPEKKGKEVHQMGIKGTREGFAYQRSQQPRPERQIQDVQLRKLFQWQLSFKHR